ncbi:WAS/WASL-interacting protein family member 3-like [Bacillus rossius redtenbacheri]|uniref:WAS/WASL-interacting protein family member 3-like n=1 Tax=Bacillus rossius redtenbacheri TaxID=93214 RepID=UPI002FDCEA2A
MTPPASRTTETNNNTELHSKGGRYVNWAELTRSTDTPPTLPPVLPTPPTTPPPPYGVEMPCGKTSPQTEEATPVQPLWYNWHEGTRWTRQADADTTPPPPPPMPPPLSHRSAVLFAPDTSDKSSRTPTCPGPCRASGSADRPPAMFVPP